MAWYDWLQINRMIASIQQSLSDLTTKVDRILAFVDGGRPPTHVLLDSPRAQYLDKKGKLTMSGSVNVTTDHDVRIPLVWKDDIGTVSAPTSGTAAISDNPAVATVDVAADDLSIVARSVAVGSCNVSVMNGKLSDTIVVNVTEPAATILDVDATDAVLIAKGAPA